MPDITIEGPDGSFAAHLPVPAPRLAPGLVGTQEIFAVNQVRRGICDRLAGEGFLACRPAVFRGTDPGIRRSDHSAAERDHAFARLGGEHDDPAAAERASGRGLDFLKGNLS